MNDPAPNRVTRLDELPRDVPPPRDGWAALEARLRAASARPDGASGANGASDAFVESPVVAPVVPRRARRTAVWFGAIAAAVAAVVAGILVDRLILQAGHPEAQRQLTARQASSATSAASARQSHEAAARISSAELPAAFIHDPRYLAARAALLASLDERLKSLPPKTRQQVLASLATIHQSMQQIQQALGREPANALLQGMLIDTYQDEMRVLTAVQEAGSGSGES